MQRALALARGVLGQSWPNPAVGAVIAKGGKIIGEGATAKGGRPHAETVALAQAGDNSKGATLYVTLEPCAHQGQTPPCTEAIIASGIRECVIACRDPNPEVNGKGIAQLRAAGIAVTEGMEEKTARELNRGFFSVIEKNRPFIAMKIATSRDGKIAARAGERTDITDSEAREHSQHLRAEFDAILTGIGTVLADDPRLTVRIPGMEDRSPVRVVLDSHGMLPLGAKVRPAWVYRREDDVVGALTERGITRLLIEAGQGVNTSFLQSGLVDRVYWYQAPHIIGEQGMDAAQGGLSLAGWRQVGARVQLGPDHLDIYEKTT
ncbi:MAG: bifunctional diaminohydroxyphosphoribosylaminopyrimidine deaminase/5-amino-6-(5-phosphoribosylamino)uracil reductase RibD [Alphaproteobacteria bacterium]|nr:bifunctional diaminohydroxyphosphoribosylaminopyrimidine deaminase/5-amino-6-(5-phosphoribosylamino)uracil reductase RibD [Alphaproteobacteria bacterium]